MKKLLIGILLFSLHIPVSFALIPSWQTETYFSVFASDGTSPAYINMYSVKPVRSGVYEGTLVDGPRTSWNGRSVGFTVYPGQIVNFLTFRDFSTAANMKNFTFNNLPPYKNFVAQDGIQGRLCQINYMDTEYKLISKYDGMESCATNLGLRVQDGIAPPLGAPSILLPKPGEFLANYPRVATLEWLPVYGAASYELAIERSNNNGDYTQLNPPYIVYGTKFVRDFVEDNLFRFRVRARAPNGLPFDGMFVGPWSDYRYFNYQTATSFSPAPNPPPYYNPPSSLPLPLNPPPFDDIYDFVEEVISTADIALNNPNVLFGRRGNSEGFKFTWSMHNNSSDVQRITTDIFCDVTWSGGKEVNVINSTRTRDQKPGSVSYSLFLPMKASTNAMVRSLKNTDGRVTCRFKVVNSDSNRSNNIMLVELHWKDGRLRTNSVWREI